METVELTQMFQCQSVLEDIYVSYVDSWLDLSRKSGMRGATRQQQRSSKEIFHTAD